MIKLVQFTDTSSITSLDADILYEFNNEGMNIHDIMYHLKQFLGAIGYAEETINRAFGENEGKDRFLQDLNEATSNSSIDTFFEDFSGS